MIANESVVASAQRALGCLALVEAAIDARDANIDALLEAITPDEAVLMLGHLAHMAAGWLLSLTALTSVNQKRVVRDYISYLRGSLTHIATRRSECDCRDCARFRVALGRRS